MKLNLLIITIILCIGQTSLISQIVVEEPVFSEMGGPSDPNRIGAPVIVNNQEYYIKSNETRNYKVVIRNDSLGLIKDNQFIIPLSEYDNIDLESYGIRVRLDKKFGLFDIHGMQVLPFENTRMYEFLPGIGIYNVGKRKSRLFNASLRQISDSTFCGIMRNSPKINNILVSSDCENYKLYSTELMKYIDTTIYTDPKSIKSGYLVKQNEIYGGINFEGEQNINFKYDDFILDMNSSGTTFILAKHKNKWGIVDVNENILIPFNYDTIHTLSLGPNTGNIHEQIYIVKQNNKWGIIKGPKTFLTEITHDSLFQTEYTSNNLEYLRALFIAKNNDKYRLLNILGENILNDEYEYLEQLGQTDNYKVKLNKKFGILNTERKILVPIIYDKIHTEWERTRFYTEINDKKGIVDIETGMTIDAIYPYVTQVDKSGYIVSFAEPEFVNGFISYDGETLIEVEFKSILLVREYNDGKWLKGLLVTNTENKIALFDWQGNQITNFIFDEVEYYERESIQVSIGDSKFEIDQYGNCIKDCPKDKVLDKLKFTKE